MATCLVIRALSLNDVPLSQPIHGIFDQKGGSIGRADTNTMTLPDPNRLISRLHARVSWDRSDFWIQDVGHGIGSLLNGRPIGNAGPVRLRAHDELRIGGYRLIVDDVDASTAYLLRQGDLPKRRPAFGCESPADEASPRPLGRIRPQHSGADAFADLLVASSAPVARQCPDPFADLIGNVPSTAVKPADGFNPLKSEPVVPALASSSGDPFALIGDESEQPGALDKVFGLDDRRRMDPLAELNGPPARHPPKPAPNHTPELKGAYVPPRIIEPGKAGTREAESKPAEAGPGSTAGATEDMWHQFLDGAGLPRTFPQPPTPYVMHVIGNVLRELTEGLLQLLAVRAAGKNQLRAEMTLIRARNNNPLKFSPNACAALSFLLQPPMAGFLSAPDAVRDAMKDLHTHQVGTMAGMKAALESLLDRFDPHILDRQLTPPDLLDELFPARRRAKLWELYLQQVQAIRGDGGANQQQLFGSPFLRAYEKQVDRLESAHGQGGDRR